GGLQAGALEALPDCLTHLSACRSPLAPAGAAMNLLGRKSRQTAVWATLFPGACHPPGPRASSDQTFLLMVAL
ncbi:hypothetical protein, partial [Mesorhizobium sp. M1E.F.Ca.ET.063.01.1.1]|uniref:hypothetical protein n=1 Tax=Mesorhizobium sp. M1E.F.Ca.ET.063.01.1.1 TaxID=2496750 RepID=UPI001AED1182